MSDETTPHKLYRSWIYIIAQRVMDGYRPSFGEEAIWREAAEIERRENPKGFSANWPIKQSA